MGLSAYHLQRLFKRWAGISPKRFVQYLTFQYSRNLLDAQHDLLDVSFKSGLSGPSRLHDLYVQLNAVSPGEYKRMGRDLVIFYGFHQTTFGECLLAITDRGICALFFVAAHNRLQALQDLKKTWPLSELKEVPDRTQIVCDRIFSEWDISDKLALYVKGTNLQVKVWEALLRIPQGSLCSYQAVAQTIGQPKATRAVANAVGANLVSYLIPCHRVLRKCGGIGGYRWGVPRKRAMLARELASPLRATQPLRILR